ncbi:hypothetical protein [Suttonella indologenes]|uniref:DUF8108 domain-containing protein n=1 Tax=Suttonella indologenes TaxID=13276 RepID=A0A380MWK1_9GAMM|nr:hypothetical protein [Suttonella indologenes]SUO96668.1 Uncharacterised protein [Suttonella indologenes]
MAEPRLRKVTSKKEMENVIDDFVTQGYIILEQSERNALLKKKTWGTGSGHVICALVTVWFTFGIGNLVYAIISNVNAPKVLLKMEDSQ